MRMVICSVRDAKMESYARPWFVQTTGVAIRSFTDEVNREEKENPLNTHPEDYALYEIGLFDDADGKIYPYDVPKLLVQADQVKVEKKFHRPFTAV